MVCAIRVFHNQGTGFFISYVGNNIRLSIGEIISVNLVSQVVSIYIYIRIL